MKLKKTIKIFTMALAILSLSATSLQGQPKPRLATDTAVYMIKFDLLNESALSMPTLKLRNELLLFETRYPVYGILDLGYNFYSVDEMVKSKGYYIGAGLSMYKRLRVPLDLGFSVTGFYQQSDLLDYLKTTRYEQGLGEYYQYEQMGFIKQRSGLAARLSVMGYVWNRWLLECGLGVSAMHMQTITPDVVTQKTFVNGANMGKDVYGVMGSLFLSLGYKLF